jgi:hypothetical protein
LALGFEARVVHFKLPNLALPAHTSNDIVGFDYWHGCVSLSSEGVLPKVAILTTYNARI